MNIKKLIVAAKEIDLLAKKQEARTKAWQQLAIDAKNGLDEKEKVRRKHELDVTKVIDFGTSIKKLRAALHSS